MAPVHDLLDALERGEPGASERLHAEFAPRLIALARQRLSPLLNARTDPESVVQSALGSFFRRYDSGEFQLGSGDDIWGLLVVIVLRKCRNRARYHQQARRDVRRDIRLNHRDEPESGDRLPADPAPEPPELLALAETLASVFRHLDADDRAIMEMLLAGHTIDETRRAVDCGERTVRRVRDRVRARLRSETESP